MAPENTTTNQASADTNQPSAAQATRPAQPSGLTVIVPRPEADAELVVPSSPSGVLELGFDPQQATVSREGFNLVFQVDGGGRVIIQDYFIVGDKALPALKLPADADNPEGALVASEDFFSGSDLDMTTAAGPTGPPPGSGSDGSGDPLSMTVGVDRLGDQDTWYWERANEIADEMIGNEYPGGDFTFTVGDNIDDGFGPEVLRAYEDGRANQHVEGSAGNPRQASKIDIAFSPGPGSSVDGVVLSGLPEGTQIWLGDPADGGALLPEASAYTLSQGDFTGQGVYLIPPQNSDDDFDFNIAVTFTRGGNSITVSQNAHVIVDAVADLPDMNAVELADMAAHEGAIIVTENESSAASQKFENGWATDALQKTTATQTGDDTDPTGVTYTVPVTATVTFYDFSDNSESHYVLIGVPDAESGFWSCPAEGMTVNGQALPAGAVVDVVTLWFDAQGAVVEADDVNAVESKDFFRAEVPASMIPQNGQVTVRVDLVAANTDYVEDTSFIINVGAMAVESPSDDELRLDNNVSYNFGTDEQGDPPGYEVRVDTVDSGLVLKIGWASEGNNDARHLSASAASNQYAAAQDDLPDGFDLSSTAVDAKNFNTGAPLSLDIGSAGTAESITQVSFTIAGGLLLADGSPLADGGTVGGYTVGISGDTVTLLLDDSSSVVTSLDDLKLTAVPAGDFDHTDLAVVYTVTVESLLEAGGTGASAVFSGTSVMVVDAVADNTQNFTAKLVYAESSRSGLELLAGIPDGGPALAAAIGNTEAAPGESVTITGTVMFPDMSEQGAEHHYIVLNMGEAVGNGWAFPGSDALLDAAAVEALFQAAGGSLLPSAGLSSDPSVNNGNQYLLLEVIADDTNNYKLVDASGNEISGVVLGGPSNNGVFTYTLVAQAPQSDTDVESTIQVTTVVVVENPNPGELPGVEYDYVNNIARGNTYALHLNVDVVTTGLMAAFTAAEDNQADQHMNGESDYALTMPEFGLPITLTLVELYPAGHERAGDIVEENGAAVPAADPDALTSLTFNSLPDAASQGTIYYQGEAVTLENVANITDATRNADDTITISNPQLTDFTFKPVEDFSGDVPFDVSAVIESVTSNATAVVAAQELVDNGEGVYSSDSAHMHVDSVADLANGEIGGLQREHDDPYTAAVELEKNFTATAGDGQFADGSYARGWYTTEHGAEQTYTVSLSLDVAFTDPDGSEKGDVLIKVPQGIDAENGDMVIYFDGSDTPAELVSYPDANGSVQYYWQLASGVVGDDLENLTGAEITVVVKTGAKNAAELQLVVRTTEGADADAVSHLNDEDNDAAVFIGEPVRVALPTLETSIKVEVGWAYEDQDADKFGGTAAGPDADHDAVIGDNDFDPAALEGDKGVPVRVTMTNAEGEAFEEGNASVIEFTYDAASGDLCWRGAAILNGVDNDDGTVTVKVSADQLADLSFKPNYDGGYSDEDIKLEYAVTVTDEDEGVQFVIRGESYVVMDAVADQAVVDAVDAKANNDEALSVVVGVTASFPDNDGSEAHYILVEAGRGWVCNDADGEPYEIVTVFRDADGNILAPAVISVTDNNDGSSTVAYDYTTAPEGAVTEESYYKIPASDDMKNADGDYAVTITPEDPDNMADIEGLKVGSLASEENISGHEYDYSNNNAFSFGETDVNVIDAGLHGKGSAYEDSSPEAHKGGGVDGTVNYITVSIGSAGVDGAVTSTGEYLDLSLDDNKDSRVVTIEFSFDGTGAEIAALLAEGSFTLGDNTSSAIQDLGGGRYRATIDIAGSGLSGKLEEISVRYNPPLDQDNDLTDVKIIMPVTNDTGFKSDLTSSSFDVAVDAVADLPTQASGTVTDIAGHDPSEDGWKASWGDSVQVEVSANFSDSVDGSEKHYLMIEAREGWTCETTGVITVTLYYDDSGNLVYPDADGAYDADHYSPAAATGVTAREFFALEVESYGADGSAVATFTLTAPDKDATNQQDDIYEDVITIANDGEVTFITGGLAVEGSLTAPSIEGDPYAIDAATGKNGDEIRYDNNIAFAQGTVSVGFNVINSVSGDVHSAFEDHDGNKHYAEGDQYSGTQVSVTGKDGVIILTLNDPDGADVITGNVSLAFTIAAPEGWTADDGLAGLTTLGTFALADSTPIGAEYISVAMVTDSDPPQARVTVNIPDEAIDNHSGEDAAPEVRVQYNPPAFGDTDLTDLGVSMDVDSTNSNDKGTLTDDNLGDLIVDAVADRPVAGAIDEEDIDYGVKLDGSGEAATAAIPGGKVTVEVSVTFTDITEGGEQHYIAVNNSGWAEPSPWSADGLPVISSNAGNPNDNSATDTYTLFGVDDVILAAIAEADGASGYTYSDTSTGLTVELATVDGHYTATVITKIEVQAPDTATSGTKTLEVCGVAVDADTDDSLETLNDQAWDMVTTSIQVQTVTTEPTLSMVDGRIYENLTPNAHLTQEQIDWPGEDGEDNARHPDYVDEADGQGALMEFSGLDDGETAEITLTFSLENGKALADAPDGMARMGVWYAVDTEPTYGALGEDYKENDDGVWMVWKEAEEVMAGDPPEPTGVWTVTLPDAANGAIIYEPGHNYNSDDIRVEYVITVTDDATGQSRTWEASYDENGVFGVTVTEHDGTSAAMTDEQMEDGGYTALTIEVDAVAQLVGIGDLDTHGLDGYDQVERGQPVFLEATLRFSDLWDDSQGLYLLVEATSDMMTPISLTLWVGDGAITLTYPDDWASDTVNAHPAGSGDEAGQYYKVNVDLNAEFEINGETKTLKEWLDPDGDGQAEIKVTYELDSTNVPSGTEEVKIRIGAGSYEKAEVVWEPAEEWEATVLNNSSLVVSGTGTITFAEKPTFSLGGEIWVSENDTSRANLDDPAPGIQPDESPDGGAVISLNPGNGGDSFTLEFTDVPGGTLYYMPAEEYGNVDAYGQYALQENSGGNPALSSQSGYVLVYVPDNDNYSDVDLALTYRGTVTSSQTGQTASFGESGGLTVSVNVDAVAQMPLVVETDVESVTLDHDFKLAEDGAYQEATFVITVEFADNDGSENHYALVQVMPNMTVAESVGIFTAPDGTLYYKIPVSQDETEVEVTIQWTSRKLGMDHDQDTIKIGALAEESVADGANREQNYDNNMAYRVDGEITVNHNWPDGDVIWIDPAYENDTPAAHQDDPEQDGLQPDETPAGGAQIHIGYIDGEESVEKVSFTIPKDADGNPAGSIWLNGEEMTADAGYSVTTNADGSVTYTISASEVGETVLTGYEGLTFVPAVNYSDADVTIGYEFTGTGDSASGSFPVIVDAVAQLPGIADQPVTPDYDADEDGTDNDQWTAAGDADGHGNEGLVTFTVSGEFEDMDGSEAHYALLEKKPGYSVVDENGEPVTLETVYLQGPDGEVHAYYKVLMENGASVDVTVKVDADAFDSNKQFSIQTGVMNRELNTGASGNLEADISNNVSWNLEDGLVVIIDYSPVDSTVAMAVDNTGENDTEVKGEHGGISITVSLGDYDKLESLELIFDPAKGKVVWGNGEDSSGELDIHILLSGAGFSDFTDGDAIRNALEGLELRFVSTGYDDEDTSLSIQASFSDSRSGDEKSVSASPATVVVDAIGHAPDIEKAGAGGREEGSTAAKAGEILYAEVVLSFEDVGTGEAHYAMMGQHQEWPCTAVEYWVADDSHPEGGSWVQGELITFFDKAGKPYYALKVEDAMLEVMPDGSGDIQVRFVLDAPEKTEDSSASVNIGGISLDPNMGSPADRELDLGNNWAENFTQVDLKVGVVDVARAIMAIAPDDEDTPLQLVFTLTGGNNDSIQSVTVADLKDGTLVDADGSPAKDINGDEIRADSQLPIVLDGATAQNGGYYYLPPANEDGTTADLTLEYSITVQDNASLDTRFFDGKVTPVIAGVADAACSLSIGSIDHDTTVEGTQDTAKPGGTVSFMVAADFSDIDGSENHWILVEALEGWDCTNDGAVMVEGYWQIPVDGTQKEVSVLVTMTVPESAAVDETVALQVGAMSRETGADAYSTSAITMSDKAAAVTIGAVQSTADDISITAGPVKEDAEGVNGAAITINLDEDAALANNETITAIEAGDLNGGMIWDSLGGADEKGGWLEGDTLDLEGAQSGRYLYVAAKNVSGDVDLTFTVTVTDTASGAARAITDSVTVFVTPVTDAPFNQSGSHSDPTVESGHTATLTLTLSAAFADYTGTEEHFFLVKLPDGATLMTDYREATEAELEAANMTGPAYYIMADDNGAADIALTLSQGFADGLIEYKAGAVEQAVGDYEGGEYAFSPAAADAAAGYAVSANGNDFNIAPTLSAPAVSIDVLRDEGGIITGEVEFVDVDGDEVTLTGVKLQDGDDDSFTTAVIDGKISVDGIYGTLAIDVETGSYAYTLHEGAAPAHGTTESFVIQGTDNYSGTALSGKIALVITLASINSDPEAVDSENKAVNGGVNEDQLTVTTGVFKTQDADGDKVFITGGASARAVGNGWEIQGLYGTLLIATDGSYSYYRTDEFASGEDSFDIDFTDALGATGSGRLVIDAQAVNHAPVAEDTREFYSGGGSSSVSGLLTFHDPDDGNTVAIVSVSFGGDVYLLADLPREGEFHVLEGDGYTLKISSDGYYMFSSDAAEGTGHSFTYTVSDGSLTATGELFFGKGDEADFVFDGTRLIGTEAVDILHGLGGNDVIHALGGDNLVYGGDGDDTIYGGSGSDTLYGGAGDDVIHAGSGSDIMYGGSGSDTFVWSATNFGGADVVKDFSYDAATNSSVDHIALGDLFSAGDDGLSELLLSLASVGVNAFRAEYGDNTMDVSLSQTELQLTLSHNGQTQEITINTAEGGSFFSDTVNLDIEQAQTILENIIKTHND